MYIQGNLVKKIVLSTLLLAIVLYALARLFQPISLLTTPIHEQTAHDIIASVRHGDVLFSSAKDTMSIFNFFFINHSIFHNGIIQKENGILYLYHSHCGDMVHSGEILYQYQYATQVWHVVREPFHRFVFENTKSIFQIIRPPKAITFTISKQIVEQSEKYCAELVGRVLVQHGFIKEDSSIISYHPASVQNQLRLQGWKTFFMREL
jgi:hypothetical protein